MNDRDHGVISDTLTLPGVTSALRRDTIPGLLAAKAAESTAATAIVGLGRPPCLTAISGFMSNPRLPHFDLRALAHAIEWLSCCPTALRWPRHSWQSPAQR